MRAAGRLAVGVVAVLSVLAGCATKPPAGLAPIASSASAGVQSGTPPGDAPAEGVSVEGVSVEVPSGDVPSEGPGAATRAGMPWPGGGPALWPVSRDSGAQTEYGGSLEVVRLGFLDASAREVVPRRYLRFDYCLSGGRPTRVVASRAGAIDVIELDGTVTRTIKLSLAENQLDWQILWCRDDKTVAIEGWDDRVEYDLSTGAKLARNKTVADDIRCRADNDDSEEEFPDGDYPEEGFPGGDYYEEELPDGYDRYEGGGWASKTESGDEPTHYINIETSAVVKAPVTQWGCDGDSGYLVCPAGRFVPSVYDKNGRLTGFAHVGSIHPGDCNWSRMPELPYLWAWAGKVQGYIDKDGAWRYQESRYPYANDD